MRLQLVILFLPLGLYSQVDSSWNRFDFVKPAMLPIHPLGIFSMRLANNFREHAVSKTFVSFGVSSGNVWLPQIDTYIPNDMAMQQKMADYSWYFRQDIFNKDSIKAQKTSFAADGVIQEYKCNIITSFKQKHEIQITLKAYRLSGKAILSLFTSDRTVETFHRMIGINDPFKRSTHAFDSASIRYVDSKGNALKLNNGDFVIPGTEVSYFYFPKLNSKYFNCNVGAYSGINFSKYNAGIDFGISASLVGSKVIKNRKRILGFGGVNGLKKKIIPFNSGVMINNYLPILGVETELCYQIQNNKKAVVHSFAVNYYYQTAFFSGYPRTRNYGDLIFVGTRNFRDWALTSAHLYENIQTARFIYSITKKITVTFYFEEDFKLNNAPDVQTGVYVAIPFCRVRTIKN